MSGSRMLYHDIGAFMITYIVLGVSYYIYSILYPKNLILIIKAPTLGCSVLVASSSFLIAWFQRAGIGK